MQLPSTCASEDLSRAAKSKRIGESRPVAGACGFAFQSSRECDENEVQGLLRENMVCSFAWAALLKIRLCFLSAAQTRNLTVNFSILNCSFVWAAVCGNWGCNFWDFVSAISRLEAPKSINEQNFNILDSSKTRDQEAKQASFEKEEEEYSILFWKAVAWRTSLSAMFKITVYCLVLPAATTVKPHWKHNPL